MSKGFMIVAQNSNVDYVRQAAVLASSIKKTQKDKNVCLMTNDIVPAQYAQFFDSIVPIPFQDHAKDSEWKIENRWKVYHASPYYETIVLDADMIALSSVDECWSYASSKDLFFTSSVINYKGNRVVNSPYRVTFRENILPEIYTGMYYFKKSKAAEQFFQLLEYITYNWQRYFAEITPKKSQSFFSMDVASAIAVKILGIEDQVISSNSPFLFVHM